MVWTWRSVWYLAPSATTSIKHVLVASVGASNLPFAALASYSEPLAISDTLAQRDVT